MKKLFTFLTLLMLFGSVGNTWAAFQYEPTTYDFETAAQGSNPSITMGASYPGITVNDQVVGQYALTMTADGTTTTDISKLAFRYNGTNRGWKLHVNGNNKGLYCIGTAYSPELAICYLHAGDKVTINFTGSISYVSGAHIYRTNAAGEVTSISSGVEYTVAQDGDLIIQANDSYTYIQTIKIEELTSVATYKITSNVNSNGVKEHKFDWVSEGRLMYTNLSIPLLDVEFGNEINGTFVHEVNGYLGSYIPDWNGAWHTWFGDTAPYQGTFYKFTPLADGKFQAGGYLDKGDVQIFHKVSEGNYESVGSASGTGYVTLTKNGQWIELKKGHTYYICEYPWPWNRTYNSFQLYWFQFNNYFDIPELAKRLDYGATGGQLVTVKTGGQAGGSGSNNFTWEVKKASPTINTSNINVTCNNGVVSISGIGYNDPDQTAGSIILGLHFDGGDADFVVTIPYSAEKGHIWDFSNTRNHSNATAEGYDGNLLIGKYSDTSSQFYQEVEKGYWQKYWSIKGMAGGTHDDYYQNTKAVAGNNAAMVWETEGLWFEAPEKTTGLYNEPDVDTYIGSSSGGIGNDHYVAILPGGSFTIPGLQKGDRVHLRMGNSEASGDQTNNFTITNACDAIGKPITTTYGHGGTMYYTQSGGDYRGSYQFISQGGDMKFTFDNGIMGKIYSIEIYRGNKSGTLDMTRLNWTYTYNDKVYQNYYWVSNEWRSDEAGRIFIAPHWTGKGQKIKATVLYTSGNVDTGSNKLFTASANGEKVFFQSAKEEFGMFRLRVDDMDKTNTYVADYALQNITVGWLQKKTYPYTWDFTDLIDYANTDQRIKKEQQKVAEYGNRTGNDYYKDNTLDNTNKIEFMNNTVQQNDGVGDVKTIEQWKSYEAKDNIPAGFGLQVRNEPYSGGLMWYTGELYGGNQIFEESFGISIGVPNLSPSDTYNNCFRICDGGIYVKGGNWRFMVPEVSSSQALYARVGKIGGANGGAVTAGIVDGAFDYKGTADDGSGDMIYAVKGKNADITLYFNNAVVKKIAISDDFKQVDKLGYCTESRAREIDPELMGYMTGKSGLKAYTVNSINYATASNSKATVGLVEIPADKTVSIASTGDHNAYIIHHNTENDAKEVNIIDNQFNLFVPDLHDEGSKKDQKEFLDVSGNQLISNVNSAKMDQTDGIYTNYLMNYTYNDPKTGQKVEGTEEAFYRASSNARLGDNKAYLKLETAKVDPKENPYANAKFVIVFEGDEQSSETTVINGVESIEETSGDNAIYTLSGMRVSNPQRGMIYVKNGKKFIVK